jgi:hypothetical protein
VNEQSIKDFVWAKVYIAGKNERLVVDPATGQKMTVGISRSECDTIVRSLIDKIGSEIVDAHDWDFKFDQATENTIANTAEYALKGNDNDAYDVVNIQYGDNDPVLEKLNVLETDRRAGDKDESGVYGWTQYGRSDDGFPQIQFVNTPTEVVQFHYRYRKLVAASALDSRFDALLQTGVLSELLPEYRPLFERGLAKVIDAYAPGGDEYETVRMSPTVEQGNIRRKGLQGGA